MAYIDAGGSDGGGGKSSGGGFNLSSLLSGNVLGGLLGAGGGLLAGVLGNTGSLPYQGNLESIAGQAGQGAGTLGIEGQDLIQPLITGKLPAGADAEVQQFINKQTADTKARYASLGQTGSTMETDALNTVQNNAAALRFQITQQMAQTGLQATSDSIKEMGVQADIYSNLMKAQMSQDTGMFGAIGSFAGALGKVFAL